MHASTEKRSQMSPILVGLMGSGKSSIGRRLAKALEMPLIDLDKYIVEKAGQSIPDIFAEQGEEAFRDLESQVLREALLGPPAVIATGGGIVLREENRALLKSHPPVIWLKTSLEFLAGRIDGDSNRPMIAGGDTLKTLQQMAEFRYPLYEQCADLILPRGDMTRGESKRMILEFLKQWQNRGL